MLPDFRLRQREHLLRISQAMSSKLDLRDLLILILESSAELLAGQAGLIVLRQDDNEFVPVAYIGLPIKAIPLFEPLWQGIPTEHVDSIPDITLRLALASRAAGVQLRQVVALPLTYENEIQGYIYIFRSRSGASFSQNDQTVLRTFAEHAAIAVHNARLYRQIVTERERLNAIIENSGDGIMIINPFRIIKTWNKTLANLTGITAEEAIGRPCYDVLDLRTKDGTSVCHTRCPILYPSDSGRLYVEGFHQRPDGVRLALADNYSPQKDDDGEINQYIANIRDVTKLREADDLKETLLAVISHELKTPVSIIKGYAGTLAREDANWDKDTLADGLAVIEEEADKLNTLITNFLDASRLQSGTMKLKLTDVDLADMARRAVEMLKATTEKHTFIVDFPDNFPTITGDPQRLYEVLTNLLGNAIKYSPEAGAIEIGGQVFDKTIRLYVTDEGIGIPASEHQRIFERFHRVDNSLARKTPGTGLGLFLVRAVAEAHGGSVWVDSKPGEGSTFWVELPRHEVGRAGNN